MMRPRGRGRVRSLWLPILLPVLAAALISACGGHARASSASAASSLEADRWVSPTLAGPPSRTAFCTGLTALYQHAALVPDATNLRVQQQIVADFVGFEPSVVAAAPAEIAPAAKLYLGRVAGVLAALNRVSLNAAKLQPGALIPYLFDPTVKAAGTKVVAFAATDCHYTIGG